MLAFQDLYSWVRDLPIVDWHNHLDLEMLAADKPLGSLYEVWVKADPYKHRAMRICGEAEELIAGKVATDGRDARRPGCGPADTGPTDVPSVGGDEAKWAAWMRTLPKLVGNPLFAWARMELEFLGLDPEPYLRGRGENVSLANWTPSKILKAFGVETLCPCLGAGQISFLGLNGRGRPFSRGACTENHDNGRPLQGLANSANRDNGRPRPLQEPANSANRDNGRPRPLQEPANSANRDNGRPRPLQWTPPSLRLFSSVCSDHTHHFSNSLESDGAHRRNLPHVSHDSALVFITFRLADSLPADRLRSFGDEKEQWLLEHPKPWDEATAAAYFAEIGDRVDHWLDAGHGSCLLADERCRRIVEESLEYFNGQRIVAATDGDVRCPGEGVGGAGTARYKVGITDVPVRCAESRKPRYILHGYVVMPNHVHVLVELIRGADMTKIVQGWKSFSARKINDVCGTTGTVWREEYYDRLIRDESHYRDVLAYLKKNETAACAIVHARTALLRSTDGDVRCPGGRAATDGDVRCPGGRAATDGDVRCPGGRVATDGDVRCAGIVPSLRMNAGDEITDEALRRFAAAGCRVVDISVDDTTKLATEYASLARVAAFAAAHDWTMLLHLGALRETSARLRAVAGPAGGFAGMRAPVDPADVARFLNRLECGTSTDGDVRCPGEARGTSTDGDVRCPGEGCPGGSVPDDVTEARDNGRPRPLPSLPRTILLSLNPEAHAQLAVLAGSFNGEGMSGKVQLGPAWWWCDHEEGIRDVLEKNAAYGVLSTFVGMTTDSRSILSFVRHDYFRRILCRWTAEKIAAGAFPDDEGLIRPILENICYRNAARMVPNALSPDHSIETFKHRSIMSYCTNKVAVVTGAGGTLCSAIAIDLARQGAKVVLIGRTAAKLEKTADAIRAAGNPNLGTTDVPVRCADVRVEVGDVTDEKQMREIADRVAAEWGPCRFLVNGAGGNQPPAVADRLAFDPAELTGPMADGKKGWWDVDLKVFESVLMTNTMGTVIPSRVFARQMAAAGGGAILNFGSMNTYRPLTRVAAYAMSKAAIANWTQFLAQYLAPAKIRVNAVAPGFFVNDRSRKILCTPEGGLTARGEQVMAHTPARRFGEASELLGCVNWLLDDEKAGFVTGITVPVDGGFLASAGV